jgi:hypothetical protein
VHNSDNLCELWHKRMGHLHHKALPILRETAFTHKFLWVTIGGFPRNYFEDNNHYRKGTSSGSKAFFSK